MFFLLGGEDKEITDLGPTFTLQCPACEQEEDWRLIVVKTRVVLWSIRLFHRRNVLRIACPVCQTSLDVPPRLFEKARRIAEIKVHHLEKRSNDLEYQTHMEHDYQDGLEELKLHLCAIVKKSGGTVRCPACRKIAHARDGRLYLGTRCVRCSQEMPAHLIRLVKTLYPESHH